MRAGILQNENVVGFDIELGIVDARGQILERSEHHRPALVLEQIGIRRRAFEDGALRRDIAEQRHQPALRLERLFALGDDGAVDEIRRAVLEPFAQGLAGHRQAIEMQQVAQFAQQRADAAGGEEIFHVAGADRLQIHQHRRGVGQFIEPLAAKPECRRGRRSRSDG